MYTFAPGKNQFQELDSHNLTRTHVAASAAWDQPRPVVYLQRTATSETSKDIYEQEADHIAEQVLRTPDSRLRPTCPCGGGCPGCLKDKTAQEHPQLSQIQASDSAEMTATPPIVSEVLSSGGKPMDSTTRAFMESRLGHDFSPVRIHTGTKAEESAQAVNAVAYTVGRDVVFGSGSYQPETSQGQRLLAHELSHVVQQKGARPLAQSTATRPTRATPGPQLQKQEIAPWEGVVETEEGPLMIRATPEITSPSHLNAVGKLPKDASVTVLSGSKFGWLKVRGTTTEGVEKTGFVLGKYIGAGTGAKPSTGGTSAASGTPPISVDSIEVVTSSTGAVTGFTKGVGNSDPNIPGPFNTPPSPLSADWPLSGECTNVHQIHFHLDNGDSANVKPSRKVKATWSYGAGGADAFESKMPEDKTTPPPGSGKPTVPGGFAGTRSADDGPPPHEILRSSPDKIGVSDTPGVKSSLGTALSPYPFKMDMAFVLTLWAKAGYPVARVTYSVFIEKRDETDVPNTRNEVVVNQKQDLVRDRLLP